VKGKIVFIDNAMVALQDGAGYGPYGDARRAGPSLAASKGAVGVLIRSIGTDHNRDPHTGVTMWPKGVAPIPAAAVSAPDADLIALRARHGVVEQVALTLTPRFTGDAVGQCRGRHCGPRSETGAHSGGLPSRQLGSGHGRHR
jgi:hypothetical protein